METTYILYTRKFLEIRSHGSRERKREIPFREIPFEKECFSFPPREFYFTIMSGTLVSIRLTRPG